MNQAPAAGLQQNLLAHQIARMMLLEIGCTTVYSGKAELPEGAGAADAGVSSSHRRSAGRACWACTAGMVPFEAALACGGAGAGNCPSVAAMLGFTLNSDNFLGPFSSSAFACTPDYDIISSYPHGQCEL